MNSVTGKIHNGQIALGGPLNWPEGTPVCVVAMSSLEGGAQADLDLDESPEEIARWIAEFDAIPPLEMSAEEEARWQAARRDQRALDLSKQSERLAGLGVAGE
jgi:hypothetical protein